MSTRRRSPARPEPAARWLPSAAELRARRARLRQRLADAPAGMKEGEWPIPLVVAHLWRWDRTAVAEIRRQRRGDPPTASYRQFEAWNQRWAEEDAGIELDEALRRWDEVFGELVDLVHDTAPEEWDENSREWLLEACWNHYADHLAGE